MNLLPSLRFTLQSASTMSIRMDGFMEIFNPTDLPLTWGRSGGGCLIVAANCFFGGDFYHFDEHDFFYLSFNFYHIQLLRHHDAILEHCIKD